uniref:2-dehydropantoate 2-reductase n=1 Tax=Strigomonas oncopelti TaxID=5657 RepID=T1YRL4_STROO|nr:2-dehydropantoate 2-reductase [Strigomonas oncopelti]
MYGSLAVQHKDKNDNVAPKFIVDSERKHKYVKSDIYVNGQKQNFQFVTPEEEALKGGRRRQSAGEHAGAGEEEEGLVVVMICTKLASLTAALEQCRPFVCLPPTTEEDEAAEEADGAAPAQPHMRPNVVIFSVINGITKESVMAQYYPKSAIVAGVAQAVAGRTTTAPPASGHAAGAHGQGSICVNYDYVGKVHVGEADGDTASPRLRAVATYLNNAGITCEIQGNIRRIMWSKFMLNVGVNQAVTAAMGSYFDIQKTAAFRAKKEAEGNAAVTKEERYQYANYNNPQARQWMMEAMREALTLSHFVPCYDFEGHPAPRTPAEAEKRSEMQAMKINLTDEDVAYWDDVMQGVDGQQAPSMRQDIGAGRQTELPLFAETIIALGKKYNVPTPVNQELYDRIAALERNL